MIRSSACLSADDLSIRCRVRRSPFTANPEFEDAMEMTCTMRHWVPEHVGHMGTASEGFVQKRKGSLDGRESIANVSFDPRHTGPELVLMPVEVVSPIHGRNNSPIPPRVTASHQKVTSSPAQKQSFTHIPLSDILVVETVPDTKCHKMKITTQHHGLFEFDNFTRNSRDVLSAFLRANMPRERYVDHTDDDASIPSAASTSSNSSTMDLDKLTEENMRRYSEYESMSEKVSRRTSRLMLIASELFSTVCDSACCRTKPDSSMPYATNRYSPYPGQEHSTCSKSIQVYAGELEEEESSMASESKQLKSPPAKRMPSGLSIEMETSSMVSVSGTGTMEVQAQRKTYRKNRKNYSGLASVATDETEEACLDY